MLLHSIVSDGGLMPDRSFLTLAMGGLMPDRSVGTKGVSQVYHLGFDDNKVLKIINWIC